MATRLVAALAIAIASSMGCGLQFDRFDPVDGSAQSNDGAMDASEGDAAPVDAGNDVSLPADAEASDGAGTGDAGSSDGAMCGARGQPCCPGHTCNQGLICRGSTCRL